VLTTQYVREGLQLRCPYCGYLDSRVVDSRAVDDGVCIKRRRECSSCQRRFTTFERVDEIPLLVIKRDGRREAFDRQKIMNGLIRAGKKRPVSLSTWEELVNKVEQELRCIREPEVKSEYIGKLVLHHLAGIDQVAYVRFASVYRQFASINDFKAELDNLRTREEAPS